MISRRRFFAISLAVVLFAMFGVEDRCFHKSSQLELSDGHSIHHLKGSLLHFILVVHRFTIAVKVFDLLLVVIQVDASLDVLVLRGLHVIPAELGLDFSFSSGHSFFASIFGR